MVAAAQAIQIAPRDQHEIEQASRLYRSLLHEGTAALIGPDGSRIDLPSSMHEILVRVVETMQEGNAIAVMPLMEELSTQAAADLLGVSRQFFVRECEAHKLPFHYTGIHRRVLHELHEQGTALGKPRTINEVLISLEMCRLYSLCNWFAKSWPYRPH